MGTILSILCGDLHNPFVDCVLVLLLLEKNRIGRVELNTFLRMYYFN
jgi:hypothetical protein